MSTGSHEKIKHDHLSYTIFTHKNLKILDKKAILESSKIQKKSCERQNDVNGATSNMISAAVNGKKQKKPTVSSLWIRFLSFFSASLHLGFVNKGSTLF